MMSPLTRTDGSIQYYCLLISLFEPFVGYDAPDGEANAENIVSQAKGCLETLVRIYYLRHSFESYDPALSQFLSLLAFSVLEDVPHIERNSREYEVMRSTLVLCAKGLWDQGRCSYVSEAILHLLMETADDEDSRLIRKFTEIDKVSDMSTYVAHMGREIRSKWPIGAFTYPREGEYHTLDRFLQRWKANEATKGTIGEHARNLNE